MAVRRPLVIVAGQVQELPAVDSLPGGGGSATINSTVVNIPYGSQFFASVQVTDAAISAASKLVASLAGGADTAENEADDIADWQLTATPGAGVINFNFFCPGVFGGPVTANYLVG